jgi:hypothetical protein
MIKKYILCRSSKINQNFIDNIEMIDRNNNLETIYINTGSVRTKVSVESSPILSGNLDISVNELTNSGTPINLTTITDYGSNLVSGMIDDGNVPIPMGGMTFNFFGTNYSYNMFWNSNCAITFGLMPNPHIVSFSKNTIPAILLGNYDRILKKLSYINNIGTIYSITTLYLHFFNYFNDNTSTDPFYKWRIRLIRENSGSQRQFIEVCVGHTAVATTGYSSSLNTYPSGLDANGKPIDSNGFLIDQTKSSPYNITNGTLFINPCGTTYGVTSPPVNTSFVFYSDSTGTNWVFRNNAFVNI